MIGGLRAEGSVAPGRAPEGKHVYGMDKVYKLHVLLFFRGERNLESTCEKTKQHAQSVCRGSEPLSAYGSTVGLRAALRCRHRRFDTAPKMPGLCSRGLM